LNLAQLVTQEVQVPVEAIMFLRHGNDKIALLRRHGVTIEEYTRVQPIGSKYDYFNPAEPRIAIVVVVAEDRIYGVYRVVGVEEEGPTYSVATEAYKNFDMEQDIPERECRRFNLSPIVSVCIGLPVRGWEGRAIATVQRSNHSFFNEVEVGPTTVQDEREFVEQNFQRRVFASLRDTSQERAKRLALAERIPHRVALTSFVFARNPDVVAETLFRANGICQMCGSAAPFIRRSDHSPYLEVHHRTPLSERGEDTVENAIALCPNCHRKAHYS
jgi:hypothetical protein